MSPLLETICLIEGVPQLLDYHQRRLSASIAALWPGQEPPVLADILPTISTSFRGCAKWRLEIFPEGVGQTLGLYYPKKINRLQLVAADGLDYQHKYLDRTAINDLQAGLPKYCGLVMVQHGLITDGAYANLVFERSGQFYTPERPLLAGVKRTYLLEQGEIEPLAISPEMVSDFEQVHLINAMLDLDETVIPVEAVSTNVL